VVTTTNMSPNSHKFWHQEEEQRLKDLVESDTPLEETAQLLRRSADAIIQKTKRLGLKIPDSWQVRRQSTKGSFQALSWIQGLLADVKDMQQLEKVRRQVDKALETLRNTAAEDFQKNLHKAGRS